MPITNSTERNQQISDNLSDDSGLDLLDSSLESQSPVEQISEQLTDAEFLKRFLISQNTKAQGEFSEITNLGSNAVDPASIMSKSAPQWLANVARSGGAGWARNFISRLVNNDAADAIKNVTGIDLRAALGVKDSELYADMKTAILADATVNLTQPRLITAHDAAKYVIGRLGKISTDNKIGIGKLKMRGLVIKEQNFLNMMGSFAGYAQTDKLLDKVENSLETDEDGNYILDPQMQKICDAIAAQCNISIGKLQTAQYVGKQAVLNLEEAAAAGVDRGVHVSSAKNTGATMAVNAGLRAFTWANPLNAIKALSNIGFAADSVVSENQGTEQVYQAIAGEVRTAYLEQIGAEPDAELSAKQKMELKGLELGVVVGFMKKLANQDADFSRRGKLTNGDVVAVTSSFLTRSMGFKDATKMVDRILGKVHGLLSLQQTDGLIQRLTNEMAAATDDFVNAESISDEESVDQNEAMQEFRKNIAGIKDGVEGKIQNLHETVNKKIGSIFHPKNIGKTIKNAFKHLSINTVSSEFSGVVMAGAGAGISNISHGVFQDTATVSQALWAGKDGELKGNYSGVQEIGQTYMKGWENAIKNAGETFEAFKAEIAKLGLNSAQEANLLYMAQKGQVIGLSNLATLTINNIQPKQGSYNRIVAEFKSLDGSKSVASFSESKMPDGKLALVTAAHAFNGEIPSKIYVRNIENGTSVVMLPKQWESLTAQERANYGSLTVDKKASSGDMLVFTSKLPVDRAGDLPLFDASKSIKVGTEVSFRNSEYSELKGIKGVVQSDGTVFISYDSLKAKFAGYTLLDDKKGGVLMVNQETKKILNLGKGFSGTQAEGYPAIASAMKLGKDGLNISLNEIKEGFTPISNSLNPNEGQINTSTESAVPSASLEFKANSSFKMPDNVQVDGFKPQEINFSTPASAVPSIVSDTKPAAETATAKPSAEPKESGAVAKQTDQVAPKSDAKPVVAAPTKPEVAAQVPKEEDKPKSNYRLPDPTYSDPKSAQGDQRIETMINQGNQIEAEIRAKAAIENGALDQLKTTEEKNRAISLVQNDARKAEDIYGENSPEAKAAREKAAQQLNQLGVKLDFNDKVTSTDQNLVKTTDYFDPITGKYKTKPSTPVVLPNTAKVQTASKPVEGAAKPKAESKPVSTTSESGSIRVPLVGAEGVRNELVKAGLATATSNTGEVRTGNKGAVFYVNGQKIEVPPNTSLGVQYILSKIKPDAKAADLAGMTVNLSFTDPKTSSTTQPAAPKAVETAAAKPVVEAKPFVPNTKDFERSNSQFKAVIDSAPAAFKGDIEKAYKATLDYRARIEAAKTPEEVQKIINEGKATYDAAVSQISSPTARQFLTDKVADNLLIASSNSNAALKELANRKLESLKQAPQAQPTTPKAAETAAAKIQPIKPDQITASQIKGLEGTGVAVKNEKGETIGAISLDHVARGNGKSDVLAFRDDGKTSIYKNKEGGYNAVIASSTKNSEAAAVGTGRTPEEALANANKVAQESKKSNFDSKPFDASKPVELTVRVDSSKNGEVERNETQTTKVQAYVLPDSVSQKLKIVAPRSGTVAVIIPYNGNNNAIYGNSGAPALQKGADGKLKFGNIYAGITKTVGGDPVVYNVDEATKALLPKGSTKFTVAFIDQGANNINPETRSAKEVLSKQVSYLEKELESAKSNIAKNGRSFYGVEDLQNQLNEAKAQLKSFEGSSAKPATNTSDTRGLKIPQTPEAKPVLTSLQRDQLRGTIEADKVNREAQIAKYDIDRKKLDTLKSLYEGKTMPPAVAKEFDTLNKSVIATSKLASDLRERIVTNLQALRESTPDTSTPTITTAALNNPETAAKFGFIPSNLDFAKLNQGVIDPKIQAQIVELQKVSQAQQEVLNRNNTIIEALKKVPADKMTDLQKQQLINLEKRQLELQATQDKNAQALKEQQAKLNNNPFSGFAQSNNPLNPNTKLSFNPNITIFGASAENNFQGAQIDQNVRATLENRLTQVNIQLAALDPNNPADKAKIAELTSIKGQVDALLNNVVQEQEAQYRVNLNNALFPVFSSNPLLNYNAKTGELFDGSGNKMHQLAVLNEQAVQLEKESFVSVQRIARAVAEGKEMPADLKGFKLPQGYTAEETFAAFKSNPDLAKTIATDSSVVIRVSALSLKERDTRSMMIIPLGGLIITGSGSTLSEQMLVIKSSMTYNQSTLKFEPSAATPAFDPKSLKPTITKENGQIVYTYPTFNVAASEAKDGVTIAMAGKTYTITDPSLVARMKSGKEILISDLVRQVQIQDPNNPFVASTIDLKAPGQTAEALSIKVNDKPVSLISMLARNSEYFYATDASNGNQLQNQNVSEDVVNKRNMYFLSMLVPDSTLSNTQKAALWNEMIKAGEKVKSDPSLILKGNITAEERYLYGVYKSLEQTNPDMLKQKGSITGFDLAGVVSKYNFNSVEPLIEGNRSTMAGTYQALSREFDRYLQGARTQGFDINKATDAEIVAEVAQFKDRLRRSGLSQIKIDKVVEEYLVSRDQRIAEFNALREINGQRQEMAAKRENSSFGFGLSGLTSSREYDYQYTNGEQTSAQLSAINNALRHNPDIQTIKREAMTVMLLGPIPVALPGVPLDPLLTNVIGTVMMLSPLTSGAVISTESTTEQSQIRFTEAQLSSIREKTGMILDAVTNKELAVKFNELLKGSQKDGGNGLTADEAFRRSIGREQVGNQYTINIGKNVYKFNTVQERDEYFNQILSYRTQLRAQMLDSTGRTSSNLKLFTDPRFSTMITGSTTFDKSKLDAYLSQVTDEKNRLDALKLQSTYDSLTPDTRFTPKGKVETISPTQIMSKYGIVVAGTGRFGDKSGGIKNEFFLGDDPTDELNFEDGALRDLSTGKVEYITGEIKRCANVLRVTKFGVEIISKGQTQEANPNGGRMDDTNASLIIEKSKYSFFAFMKAPQPKAEPEKPKPEEPVKVPEVPKVKAPTKPTVTSQTPNPNPLNPTPNPTVNPLTGKTVAPPVSTTPTVGIPSPTPTTIPNAVVNPTTPVVPNPTPGITTVAPTPTTIPTTVTAPVTPVAVPTAPVVVPTAPTTVFVPATPVTNVIPVAPATTTPLVVPSTVPVTTPASTFTAPAPVVAPSIPIPTGGSPLPFVSSMPKSSMANTVASLPDNLTVGAVLNPTEALTPEQLIRMNNVLGGPVKDVGSSAASNINTGAGVA